MVEARGLHRPDRPLIRVQIWDAPMEIPQPKPPFSYALSEVEAGWRWKVLDRTGASVAVGLAKDERTAEKWIRAVLRSEGVRVPNPSSRLSSEGGGSKRSSRQTAASGRKA